MTRAGRKTDAATTLLMVLLILTAVKLLLERLLALMLPHDLHQNTRLLLSMAQEALLIGLPALLMRRGRSARTGNNAAEHRSAALRGGAGGWRCVPW